MERAAAELFLASLFVEPTTERQEALRNAAKAAKNWEGMLDALEGHGVLLLFLRNLEQAAIELPPAVAPLYEARAGRQRDDHHRSRLALQRFLSAAARARVEATLTGGSALCVDLYSDPLRRLGESEILVAPEDFQRALDAANEAGLLLAPEALPAWWYRRTRMPVSLAPSSSLLGAIKLRSHLHHPSLLLTAHEPEVVARRRRMSFEGHPLFVLDALDALLELAVSVTARAGEDLLVTGRRHLLGAASSAAHPLRLDRILDLRTHIERQHAALPVATVLARSAEWSAEPALRAVLECIQMGLGFLPGAREWVRAVAQGLASAAPASRSRATPALFRPDPIERLPLWLRPSETFLARRYALPDGAGPRARQRARVRHLAAVLGAGALASVGFPLALLGRRLARARRQQAWEGAQAPQRMSDVSEAWKASARVEQPKAALPRAIKLPERDESVTRYPDRYLG